MDSEEKPKRRVGRPRKGSVPGIEEDPGVGSKPVNPTNRGGKLQIRNAIYSLSEVFRQRLNPNLAFEWYPNPMKPSPTLEQQNRAMAEITNRGHGLPVQSLQIDAQLKMQIQDEIPVHLLSQWNYSALAKIRDVLKLDDGNTEDAEWTDIPQEPSQVQTPTKSEETDKPQ